MSDKIKKLNSILKNVSGRNKKKLEKQFDEFKPAPIIGSVATNEAIIRHSKTGKILVIGTSVSEFIEPQKWHFHSFYDGYKGLNLENILKATINDEYGLQLVELDASTSIPIATVDGELKHQVFWVSEYLRSINDWEGEGELYEFYKFI